MTAAQVLPDPRLDALLAKHPRVDRPAYWCCEPPNVCNHFHGPVCVGDSHDLGPPPWPCAALRSAGVRP